MFSPRRTWLLLSCYNPSDRDRLCSLLELPVCLINITIHICHVARSGYVYYNIGRGLIESVGRTEMVQLGTGTLSSLCATRPCAAHVLACSSGDASAETTSCQSIYSATLFSTSTMESPDGVTRL